MSALTCSRGKSRLFIARDLPMEVQIRSKHVLLGLGKIDIPSILAIIALIVGLELSILGREVALGLTQVSHCVDLISASLLSDPLTTLLDSPVLWVIKLLERSQAILCLCVHKFLHISRGF